jgi:hypothetical protein
MQTFKRLAHLPPVPLKPANARLCSHVPEHNISVLRARCKGGALAIKAQRSYRCPVPLERGLTLARGEVPEADLGRVCVKERNYVGGRAQPWPAYVGAFVELCSAASWKAARKRRVPLCAADGTSLSPCHLNAPLLADLRR